MKVIVSDQADNDLLLIFSYLQQQSPRAAESVAAEINQCFKNVSLFHSAVRLVPISDIIEPFLIQCGYLQRTPRGRLLTSHAFRHLGLAEPTRDPAQFGLFGQEEE